MRHFGLIRLSRALVTRRKCEVRRGFEGRARSTLVCGKTPFPLPTSFRSACAAISGPTTRQQCSEGQRRDVCTHFRTRLGLGRGFGRGARTLQNCVQTSGRCSRLLWCRALGAELPPVVFAFLRKSAQSADPSSLRNLRCYPSYSHSSARIFSHRATKNTEEELLEFSSLCLCVSVRDFPFDLVWLRLHGAKRIFPQSAKTDERRRWPRAKNAKNAKADQNTLQSSSWRAWRPSREPFGCGSASLSPWHETLSPILA